MSRYKLVTFIHCTMVYTMIHMQISMNALREVMHVKMSVKTRLAAIAVAAHVKAIDFRQMVFIAKVSEHLCVHAFGL